MLCKWCLELQQPPCEDEVMSIRWNTEGSARGEQKDTRFCQINHIRSTKIKHNCLWRAGGKTNSILNYKYRETCWSGVNFYILLCLFYCRPGYIADIVTGETNNTVACLSTGARNLDFAHLLVMRKQTLLYMCFWCTKESQNKTNWFQSLLKASKFCRTLSFLFNPHSLSHSTCTLSEQWAGLVNC